MTQPLPASEPGKALQEHQLRTQHLAGANPANQPKKPSPHCSPHQQNTFPKHRDADRTRPGMWRQPPSWKVERKSRVLNGGCERHCQVTHGCSREKGSFPRRDETQSEARNPGCGQCGEAGTAAGSRATSAGQVHLPWAPCVSRVAGRLLCHLSFYLILCPIHIGLPRLFLTNV